MTISATPRIPTSKRPPGSSNSDHATCWLWASPDCCVVDDADPDVPDQTSDATLIAVTTSAP